jgi:hypothetical protein
MNPKITQKNLSLRRIAACAEGGRLVSIFPRAAGRVPASKSVSSVNLSAGAFYPTGSPKQMNLMRREIFRGKVTRAHSKTNNTPQTKDAFAPNL